jgi:hypothetical protein
MKVSRVILCADMCASIHYNVSSSAMICHCIILLIELNFQFGSLLTFSTVCCGTLLWCQCLRMHHHWLRTFHDEDQCVVRSEQKSCGS